MVSDSLVLEGLPLFLDRRSRPPHIQIPRRRIELPFAIQCMRQSYNNADELDFVAMDEFQRSFFLFRASEWEDYRQYHPTVMQGDLADPLYFDFISFAQYATIANKMRNGALEFVERIGAEGTPVVIRRDTRWGNNDLLPIVHSQRVGDALLDWMLITYPQTAMPPVQLSNETSSSREKLVASFEDFERYARLVLDIFLINSYCVSVEISTLPSSLDGVNIMTLKMRAPANLWSQEVLRSRRDLPVNDFEIKALEALARRCGLQLKLASVETLNTIDILHTMQLRKG